jgi:hypothetical protein
MFTCHPNTSHDVPATSRDTTIVSKMGPMIVVGLQQLRVQRQNPPAGSTLPRANGARDEATQRVANSWHIPDPIEGPRHPQASHLSTSREVSFMPLRAGLHLAVWVFPARDYPRMLLETTWLGFIGGWGGGINPYLVLWRGACPC